MAQHETRTFAGKFTSSANTSNQVDTVFTLDEGPDFEIQEVTLFTPGNNTGEVTAQVFAGERPVAPQNGKTGIPDNPFDLPTDFTIGPESDVEVRHDNTSANPIELTVTVKGELQRDNQ